MELDGKSGAKVFGVYSKSSVQDQVRVGPIFYLAYSRTHTSSSSDQPEIIVFGTGKTVLPVPPKIRAHLNKLGIQIEAHDTVSEELVLS
jgi:hypothetical protein